MKFAFIVSISLLSCLAIPAFSEGGASLSPATEQPVLPSADAEKQKTDSETPTVHKYPNHVYALGELLKTGVYSIDKGMTLAKLLKEAGLKPTADITKVRLNRLQPVRSGQVLDASDLMGGTSSKDIPLNGGDVIFVPKIGL